MTPIVTTIADVRAAVTAARKAGRTVGFVPTMGALHNGHASLIRAARQQSAFVIVSIFVNPTQFGPNEDFTRYPRTLDADQQLCTDSGADLIFTPSTTEVYQDNATTFVEVMKLQDVLDGTSRPGHFRGVCTVVLKLFNIVQPDMAHFGAKDYQQARIVTRMVRDLNVPVVVRVEPTVREPDGLAMSSRNRYLTPDERAAAPQIYQALQIIRSQALAGNVDVARLEAAFQTELTRIPGARIDYARIVDAENLQPITRLDRAAVAVVAVFLGNARLIDNVTIP